MQIIFCFPSKLCCSISCTTSDMFSYNKCLMSKKKTITHRSAFNTNNNYENYMPSFGQEGSHDIKDNIFEYPNQLMNMVLDIVGSHCRFQVITFLFNTIQQWIVLEPRIQEKKVVHMFYILLMCKKSSEDLVLNLPR